MFSRSPDRRLARSRTSKVLAAGAFAGAAAVTLAGPAAAQQTTSWEGDVNFNRHQFGNWTYVLPPTAEQDVSIDPYDAPNSALIYVFRDQGIAQGRNIRVRDWNCGTHGCDYELTMIGFPGTAGRARIDVAQAFTVRADYSATFGDGEAFATLASFDLTTRDLRVEEANGADAELHLDDVDVRIRPGGIVRYDPGTFSTLDGSTFRAVSASDRFDVLVQVTATLWCFDQLGENTVRDADLLVNGTLQNFGVLRTHGLEGIGTISNLGTLVVDGPVDSQYLGQMLGTGTLVKDGAGILRLAGPTKSHLGGTTIRGGAVLAANEQQLGEGDVRLDGGSLASYGGPLVLNDRSLVLQSGGGALDAWEGPITVDAAIGGGGGLVVRNGLVRLGGASTYTGGTVVESGTLVLELSSGSPTGSGMVTVTSGTTLRGEANLTSPITVEPGGRLVPGGSGDAAQLRAPAVDVATGATMAVRLGGPEPSDHDRLWATGTLTVEPGAAIEISFMNGFTPQPGQAFAIARGSDVVGTFDQIVAADPASWCVEETGLELVLRYQNDCNPGTCTGDVDGDETVGFSDLLVLLGDWSTACTACSTDFDADGDVDFDDLLVLISAWGSCG